MSGATRVESTTRAVVAEFCSYAVMFTALDVSNEVKTRITGVRHREVSPLVRAMFEAGDMDGSYTRSTINVTIAGGKTVQALLYHDASRDPDDYGQREREQRAAAPVNAGSARSSSSTAPAPPVPAPSAPPASAPSAPAPADSGGTELSLSLLADGSARIPRSFMERAGVTADEIALDSAGFGASLRLTEADEDDEDAEPLEVLEYERGGALRIPAGYLGGFGSSAKLRARAEFGVVVIESE